MPSETMSTDAKSYRILLVDDDVELSVLLREYLDAEGFQVSVESNGRDGLAAALSGQYDAVILDIMLPQLSGIEVLRKLRRESQIPVIMLTAKGDNVDRVVGLELGADDYVPKPYYPRELVARLRAVLRRQPTPADLAAMQIQERQLTALEQELTSTRNLLAQTEARIKSLQETNALLQRELTAATAAARMQDRPTITEVELAQLRIRAAAARELEQQVQQLETEKAAAMAGRGSATGDEVPRLEAARAEAEHKLNTVLRSYTLVARERDAWREQVQQLSVPHDSARTAPATTAEVATETVGRTAARANPAPRPVSFSGPEDPAPVVPSTQVDPPRSVTLGQPAFSHRIAPGETLAAIARRYYGNPKRWPEIVAANRDVLRDQRSFAAGKMIRIP